MCNLVWLTFDDFTRQGDTSYRERDKQIGTTDIYYRGARKVNFKSTACLIHDGNSVNQSSGRQSSVIGMSSSNVDAAIGRIKHGHSLPKEVFSLGFPIAFRK